MATRSNLSNSLELLQQPLSMLFHKFPGEASWTAIGQARKIDPDKTSDATDHARIGDPNKKTIYGAATTKVTLEIYLEKDLFTLARVFGTKPTSGSWAGTEELKPVPTTISDLKLVTYTGDTTSATDLFSTYINEFSCADFKLPFDASSSDPLIATVNGAARDIYIIPIAGTAS